jgi:hypothetical protein
VLPSTGTPVFLDHDSGRWWSGRGVMTEVSDDRTRCRVHARNRILIVESKWLDCRRVHERSPEFPPQQ